MRFLIALFVLVLACCLFLHARFLVRFMVISLSSVLLITQSYKFKLKNIYTYMDIYGWGYSETTKFFPLYTVRDHWLVRKEEFVQDNIANWGDPGLVSWGELSATKRLLSYESYVNYSICALTRLLRKYFFLFIYL